MPTLDRLRGTYMKAPRWVQSSAGRLLELAPPALVYGASYRRSKAEIERSARDDGFVLQCVQAKLRHLLARARMTSYYGALVANADVEHFTVDDLAVLPVITRNTVRRHWEDMLAVPQSSLEESITSGTTSAPLSVYLDRDRSVREWAFVTHTWARAGFQLRDRRAVFRHGHYEFDQVGSDYWRWDPGARELRLSPFRMVPQVMDEYLDLICRYRIAWIHGYPSAIALLARHATRVGWPVPRALKGVLPISESLQPHQREQIRAGFGPLPILPFYGLTEKVAFAAEMPGRPGDYEFEPLYGVAEVVDADGHLVSVGERGRLLGTGLISTGMPLIRYDTGDQATVIELPSAANRRRLRVSDLVSVYKQDFLVTREGGLVTPTIAYIYTKLVQDYQFSQSVPGRATLRVIPAPGVTPERLKFIAPRIQAVSDGLLSVDVDIVDEIPAGPRGKRRVVLQELDLSAYGAPEQRTLVAS